MVHSPEEAGMKPLVFALIAMEAGLLTGRALASTAYDSLTEYQAKWKASHPDRYAFTYENVCYCIPVSWRVEMNGDSVVRISATSKYTGIDTTPPADPRKYSPDSLFARIKTGLDAKPYRTDIRYNPLLGYPESAYFDPLANVADEEYGFTMMEFETVTALLPRRPLRRRSHPTCAGTRDRAGRVTTRPGSGLGFRLP